MSALRSPLVATALLALAVPGLAQKGVVDSRLGIEVKPPKGWTQMPPVGERDQLAMFFVAARALPSKATGGTHVPSLKVLFLPKGGTDANDEVDGLPRKTPFRDFDDWAKRSNGGKVQVASREAAKLGDFDARVFVAKAADPIGERTLLGGVIGTDDGEILVLFDVLSEHFDKERKDYDHVLETLAAAAKDPNAPAAPSAPWLRDPGVWKTMDAAARGAERKKFAAATIAAASAAPGVGFKESKSKYWTVLSAADPGFTKKAIPAAEAARAWCEATLPKLATPEPAVLRIFASPEQYRAFRLGDSSQREYSQERRELYFFDDPDAGTSDGFGMLFRAVLWHWLDDADPGILPAMPRWLDNGIWEYLRSTKLKGKKIEFAPSEVENGRIDYQQRNNSMPALWNLMQESMQPSPADGANEDVWGYTPECARLVRWCCEHDGGKAFGKPTLLVDYVRGLGEALRTVGPEPTRDVDTARLDDAKTKKMNAAFYAWRDAVLKACNDAVIPLDQPTWMAANEKWLKFNVDFK